MVCLSSTITSTLTLFVTVTSAIPQELPVVPSAIEGLSDCTQGVVFPLLAGSQCNPADFPCICTQLTLFQAEAAVSAACPDDVDEFLDFQDGQCRNQIAVQSPITPTLTSTTVTTPVPATNTTTTVKPVIPLTTSNATIPVVINVTNGTVVGPVAPPATTDVVLPTVGPNGEPSSYTTAVAVPTYTGAAVLGTEVPGFGVWCLGTGLLGLMGLAFAEL
ncbi:hypothetical protein DM02DRAFT_668793 [Periconia macrospinosa]|uniref:Extracellular membrane protein CFEM domain-containing protein n=1 Tax=Periconia macrospinosa TaxID=97972 RepID=A0A2V1E696_9PLEO|nr:hypothetical protein DM02DRAFT_668793 [Periconia macrospinosa]